MTTWLNLTLQDRAPPVTEQLIFFHDHALIIIIIMFTTVFYTIIGIIQNKQTRRFILEGQIIETVWTIAPAVILVFIAIPSLRLLYSVFADPSGREVEGRSLAGIAGSNLSLVNVECCQIEVSASGCSLAQRSPTECGVSECDREASITSRPWPTRGCAASTGLFSWNLIWETFTEICQETQNLVTTRQTYRELYMKT
jgi:hypothetical protein